jgi:hypothetical protein
MNFNKILPGQRWRFHYKHDWCLLPQNDDNALLEIVKHESGNNYQCKILFEHEKRNFTPNEYSSWSFDNYYDKFWEYLEGQDNPHD